LSGEKGTKASKVTMSCQQKSEAGGGKREENLWSGTNFSSFGAGQSWEKEAGTGGKRNTAPVIRV